MTAERTRGEMRDAIVLGCGRSGTSLVAGLAASAGYFMGPDLHPPRTANPLGFFEGEVVKEINESLIESVLTDGSARTPRGSRWLETLPQHHRVGVASRAAAAVIRGLTAQRPFTLKDPRFCYTLSAWRPHLPEATAYVCVFREPGRTVSSILTECRKAPWLEDVEMSPNDAESLWVAMYRRVLDYHRHSGPWLFLHYEQILDGSGVQRMAEHLQISLTSEVVQPSLKRSADRTVGAATSATYAELCALATYHG